MILGLTLLLIFLVLASGFTSASETAFFSLSSMKVKAFKQGSDPRGKKVATLLSKPRKFLVTLIMLNILVNILIQNTVSSIFGVFSGWILNVGVPLALTLIFGEMLPKSIAISQNSKIAYYVAPFFLKLQKILGNLPDLLSKLTATVSRFMFFFLKKEEEISVEELIHALHTSQDIGILGADEAELIAGFLYLEESTIKELMRPRQEILFFNLDEPLSKLIHLFVDQECTRIPVCDGGLENVKGIITSRLFFLYREKINKTEDLLFIMKKPLFIPETTDAKLLLRQFYQKKESIALVVDEYGSISGLISIEDLVEVVIGEISDRRDETSLYTKSDENTIICSGKMELAQIEEMFGVHLESKHNVVTIGGWLTEQMGDIPKSGAKYQTPDFLFHILASDHARVRRVYIRHLKGEKRK